MKEAEGAALDIFMFRLSLIEVSSLMTPRKTDPLWYWQHLGFVEAVLKYLRAEERQSIVF